MNFLHTKKFRYGSVSLALTIVIIAAVILFNAVFTALSERFLWYVDMTAEEAYTLSDEAKELLDLVNKDKEVTVIFCMQRDELEANAVQRYVLYTVLDMEKYYDNIHVKYVDYLINPSAVAKYKDAAGQSIDQYSVIVTSEGEAVNPVTGVTEKKEQHRVYKLSALYTYDQTGETVVGYNGEQRLVSAILAVTQVEVPVACYTVNHGETDSLIDATSGGSPILTLLYETGYDVKQLDMSLTEPGKNDKGEIEVYNEFPADCRLLLIFNPDGDFRTAELEKIDAFMNAGNSTMAFFDYETPYLPRLEGFLGDWGVEIARHTDDQSETYNYLISDYNHSLDPVSRLSNRGFFVEKGLGASITRALWNPEFGGSNNPKPVIFRNSTAIRLPEKYDEAFDPEEQYGYAVWNESATSYVRYDVFTSSDGAVAKVGEQTLSDGAPYSYMTVTRQNVANNKSAYLLACASTDFVSASALDSGYGNHAVLTRACHELGGAQVSVSLDCKYFTDNEINSITASAANQYTIVLTVVPAAIIFVAGVYIMVRRKYA